MTSVYATAEGDEDHDDSEKNIPEGSLGGADLTSNDALEAQVLTENAWNGIEGGVFWDSIRVHFDIWTFLYQLLIHSLLPLTAVLSPNPNAQLLNPFQKGTRNARGFFVFFLSTSTTFCLVLFVLMHIYEPDRFFEFSGCFLFSTMYAFLWRVSVAVKWASYSKTERARAMGATTVEESGKIASQVNITTNYVTYENETTIDFEIIASGLRTGVDVDKYNFTVQNPNKSATAATRFREWKAFLKTHSYEYSYNVYDGEKIDPSKVVDDDMKLLDDGDYSISLHTICKRVNRYSQATAIPHFASMVPFFGWPIVILMILIPFIPMMSEEGLRIIPSESPLTTAFLVFSTFDIVFFMPLILFMFLTGAIMDLYRMSLNIDCFNDFIRHTETRTTPLVTFSLFKESSNHSLEEKNAAMFGRKVIKKLTALSQLKQKQNQSISNKNGSIPKLTAQASARFNNTELTYRANKAQREIEKTSQYRRIQGQSSTISPTDGETETLGHPHLSFLYEDNLYTWVKGTMVMQSFKLRFRRRIEFTAIIVFILVVALIIVIFCLIFLKESEEQKLEVFSTPLFWQVLLNVTVMAVFLILYSLMGVRVNDSLDRQRYSLSVWCLNFKEMLMMSENETFATPEDKICRQSKLKKISEALSTCIDLCEVNKDVNFMEVFGLKAELSLALTIVSFLLSFYVTLLAIYINLTANIRLALG